MERRAFDCYLGEEGLNICYAVLILINTPFVESLDRLTVKLKNDRDRNYYGCFANNVNY